MSDLSDVTVVEVGIPGPAGISLAGRVVLVDAVNGDDSTGTRGRLDLPFLTPTAAKAAAQSGDTVIVYPGSYTCAASLAKEGVNWHCFPGVTITRSDGGGGIWDDGGTAMTFRVTGAGVFALQNALPSVTAAVVKCSHASSNIFLEYLDVTAADTNTDGDNTANLIGVRCQAGSLTMRCRDILSTSAHYTSGNGVWWENGSLDIIGRNVDGAAAAVYSTVNAVPTGDADLRFAQVGNLANIGVYEAGSNSAAALWVRANRVKGVNSVQSGGAARTYVKAQKLFGNVSLAGSGLAYVFADKVVLNGSGTNLVVASGLFTGTARIGIEHYDATGVPGNVFSFAGGTTELIGGSCVGPSGADGLTISGGTVRLRGVRIDTSANASGNPVTVSGGTLIMDAGTVLVANLSRDCVTAATAQTIKAYGAWANTAKNVNITVAGTLYGNGAVT